jgi:hypothetical protein
MTVLAWVIAAALGTAPMAGQARTQPPKKGDTVLIKGCLRGSAVESAGMMTVDAEGTPRSEDAVPVLTYRLQGDKRLLKDLKARHDRKVVEVKGILRSDISGSGFGKDVGRTRITIGIDPRTGRSPHGEDRAVPVLEAISFEGTTVSCDR